MRLILFVWIFCLTVTSFAVQAQSSISVFKIIEPGESLNKTLSKVPLFGSVLKETSVVGKILIVREANGVEVELDGITKKISRNSGILEFDWKLVKISADLKKLELITNPKKNTDGQTKRFKLERIFDSKPLNLKIAKLESEINQISKELEQSKANASDSENQKVKVEETLATIQSQLNDLQNQYEQAKSELNEKTAKLEDNERKLANAPENNSKRVSELETLSSSLTQTINYQKDEIENLKSKLASFESTSAENDNSLAESKARISELEKEISFNAARVQELEAELSAKGTSSSEVNRDDLNNPNANLGSATHEANEMRAKIDGLESQIKKLTTANNTISKELEAALNRVAKIKNEKSALEAKQQEIPSLKTQVKTLKDRVTQLTNKNQTLTAKLKTANEKNQSLQELSTQAATFKNSEKETESEDSQTPKEVTTTETISVSKTPLTQPAEANTNHNTSESQVNASAANLPFGLTMGMKIDKIAPISGGAKKLSSTDSIMGRGTNCVDHFLTGDDSYPSSDSKVFTESVVDFVQRQDVFSDLNVSLYQADIKGTDATYNNVCLGFVNSKLTFLQIPKNSIPDIKAVISSLDKKFTKIESYDRALPYQGYVWKNAYDITISYQEPNIFNDLYALIADDLGYNRLRYVKTDYHTDILTKLEELFLKKGLKRKKSSDF